MVRSTRPQVCNCTPGNFPICGFESFFGDSAAFAFFGSPCFTARLSGRIGWLLDCNQAHGQRRAAFAFDPNRPINQPACLRRTQLGNQIERTAFDIESTRVLPASADHNVRSSFEHNRYTIRLQIGAVSKTDLAFDHGDPVERLPLLLIGQFEMTKALVRKIERTVNAPEFALLARSRSCLGPRRAINDADQPTSARLRRRRCEQPLHKHRKPIAALTQTIEQRHAAEIGNANLSGPRGRRSQSSLTQAIGQHQPQQRHCIRNLTPSEGGGSSTPRLSVQSLRLWNTGSPALRSTMTRRCRDCSTPPAPAAPSPT